MTGWPGAADIAVPTSAVVLMFIGKVRRRRPGESRWRACLRRDDLDLPLYIAGLVLLGIYEASLYRASEVLWLALPVLVIALAYLWWSHRQWSRPGPGRRIRPPDVATVAPAPEGTRRARRSRR